ncbi:hypothetical protein ALGA_4221 [Labilibaculum antarcticum]|uniref:Uncharacterized protein n=1 Tax=Labilibaculum antarcticum TaxID=1717717 RepID=A0A1Y1CRG1_9BACT|nr:hypothetical protein ALGA_4221 [Labilibaculum antarcticum]
MEKIIDYSHPNKKWPKLNDKNKDIKISPFDDNVICSNSFNHLNRVCTIISIAIELGYL